MQDRNIVNPATKMEQTSGQSKVDNVVPISIIALDDITAEVASPKAKNNDMNNIENQDKEYNDRHSIDMLDDAGDERCGFLQRNKKLLKNTLKIVSFCLYFAYFGYSMYFKFGDEGSWRLLVCTVLLFLIGITQALAKMSRYKNFIKSIKSKTSSKALSKIIKGIRWLLYLVVLALIGLYVGITVAKGRLRNLISLAGIFVIVVLLFLVSNNKRKIRWHTVFWGLSLQFAFALLILRTSEGMNAVQWTSDRFRELMSHSDNGAIFIFGPRYTDFEIVFKVVPSVIFFFSFISILSHYQVLEFIVKNLGGALGFCLKTNAVESINAVANVFLGGIESIVMVYRYVDTMPDSCLFCLFVNGMSSIAGIAIVVYSSFGIPVEYLISASVMSAPAALVAAKMVYPSTDNEKDLSKNVKLSQQKKYKNIMEAMADGGLSGVRVMLNVLVNLLLYISFFAFINATLRWFGDRAGVHNFTLEKIFSYLLWPLSFIMGIDAEDCLKVGELLGVRAVATLGVAYIEIGTYFNNKQKFLDYSASFNNSVTLANGDMLLPNWNTTLSKGILTDRSELIATYALCGFASIPSVGMLLGSFTVLAPKRIPDLNRMAWKALLAATLASYTTACVAGILYS